MLYSVVHASMLLQPGQHTLSRLCVSAVSPHAFAEAAGVS